jgi:hypothetical protein
VKHNGWPLFREKQQTIRVADSSNRGEKNSPVMALRRKEIK